MAASGLLTSAAPKKRHLSRVPSLILERVKGIEPSS